MLGRLGQPVEHGHMDIMRETLYFHHHVSWHCYPDLSKKCLAHLWCHPHFVHASAAEGIFRVYLTCLITEFWQELLLQRSWCVHILLDVHACQAKADLDRKISKMAPQVHFFFVILQASWSLHVSKVFAQHFVRWNARKQAFTSQTTAYDWKRAKCKQKVNTLIFSTVTNLICIYQMHLLSRFLCFHQEYIFFSSFFLMQPMPGLDSK